MQDVRDKPVLEPVFPLMQTDFTLLPQGKTFVDVMGHEQKLLTGLTVVRVAQGYGVAKDDDGRMEIGGLETNIRELDRGLAGRYPVNIHVVYRADASGDSSRTIKEEGWPGEVVLHPIKGLGKDPKGHARLIMDLASVVDADIIHMHRPTGGISPLYREIVKESEKSDVGIAFTLHGQNRKKGRIIFEGEFGKVKTLLKKTYAKEGLRGVYESVLYLGRKLIERSTSPRTSHDLNEIITKKVETPNRSYALVGVSRASISGEEGLESVVIGRPVNSEFFDRSKVSEERKRNVRDRYGLNGKRVFVYHARLEAGKGQHFLIDVAQRIKEKMGDEFRIILAGSNQDVDYVNRIKSTIRKRGLGGIFLIEDAKLPEEVRDLLSVADCMLFPSLREGIGGSGIEAMLMEVPVVAHDVGGLGTYIIDSTGFLVKVGDTSAMAEKAMLILTDDDLRKRLGVSGRNLCKEMFSVDKVCEDYIRLVYGPQALRRRESSTGQ